MKEKYDTVIIGAGIGGLICGCYLSKAGLDVLIIEQQNKPGGYCVSFKKGEFNFDAGGHYLGGVRRGILGKILEELDLKSHIKYKQFDPSEKIILPNNMLYLRADPRDTIREFRKNFSKEKINIDNFFKFIMQKNFLDIYTKVKKTTFKEVVDSFFESNQLKATLGAFLFNSGTPPGKAAASPAIVLFRQYLLDPGYYPSGGFQKFPDVLAENFENNGGKIILSNKVNKIITDSNKIKGVIIDGNRAIGANNVISNADATETFKKMLDIPNREATIVDKMIPSPSMFILYLGLNINLREKLRESCNIYYFSTYNIDEIFSNLDKILMIDKIPSIFCVPISLHNYSNEFKKGSMVILTIAPYKSCKFWDKNKDSISERIVSLANKLIPGLLSSIELQICATPITLSKYTLNREGAFAGWLPILSQTKADLLPQKTSIDRLYIVGQWCTSSYLPSGGIANVALTGRRVARWIIEDSNRIWKYPELYL
ncbi:MAG: NAD(P)/FAD-dependent oxidoreductase [Candidatus Omnitrophica bacterium]|nr:NAD(P)/FAD-dependent oxidoreductase [Candidatus Omnitrophota bacterium]MDD5352247.1 NAD(P)/FAD-dependent oxidoreductase [Candidatus Omnitrophota bacterium]MDD5549845.1 NAD(P)/FAD-dependent oxidoreductase [Candidatus Omnitrophota bacterium]